MTSHNEAPDSDNHILDHLDAFDLTCFSSPENIERYLDLSGLNIFIESGATAASAAPRSASIYDGGGIAPDYSDLCRIHWLTLKRRAINVLEMGSGQSSLAIIHALALLDQRYSADIQGRFRSEKYFHLFSVDESDIYLDITRKRIGGRHPDRASLFHSTVRLIEHDGRFATVYANLPNISPDFIYLDGPSQFATRESIDGFSIDSPCRMPMSADLLRLEFFLEPGTLILVDGRTQNARFLRACFKRNWAYLHDPTGDVHYFELQEEPLGRLNREKIDFCLGGKWLLG